MKYQKSDQEIKLGDRVLYAGARAEVLALGFSAQYGADLRREDWEGEIGGGLLIRFENGSLPSLTNPTRTWSSSGELDDPPTQARAVMAAAKGRGQPTCQHAPASPRNQSARGAVRRAVRERRVENSQSVSPGHRAESPPPAEERGPREPG